MISMSRFWKPTAKNCVGLLLLLLIAMLLFTRFGVFLVFDVAGDFRGTDNFKTEYKDAPIRVTHVLDRPLKVTLPKHIEQVSGIVMHKGDFVLSTDQAELFVLEQDQDQATTGGTLFPFTPLLFRQGSIESIAKVEDEFWLAGERAAFVRTDLSGSIIGSHPLPKPLTGVDITGLAFAESGTIFVTTGDSMAVEMINLQSGALQSLQLDFQAFSDERVTDNAFLWSGVAHDNGQLYLVAENYPVIVVADAKTGLVLQALGIEGQQEFSDIAVSQGRIVLPSDHNYFDKRPPLRVYKQPEQNGPELSES